MEMKRTGTAKLPLHGGKAPRWLFERMVKLSRAIIESMVILYGPKEVLRRLSDPFWFQAFGCVLGFDWHSSGVTTTVMGALKVALKGTERDLGIIVVGGKGATSRKTPLEIASYADKLGFEADSLIYASRMAAKVDSAVLQDGYQLYHHTMVFTPQGEWAVIQQGMNEENAFARRYHWLSFSLKSFVEEPHEAIAAEAVGDALDMTAKKSAPARDGSVMLTKEPPESLVKELKSASRIFEEKPYGMQLSLFSNETKTLPERKLTLPRRHYVSLLDVNAEKLEKIFHKIHEENPENYEKLVSLRGVGPATIRALALLSELLLGKPPSFEDPARYSFAHGGKDGHPYPVNRKLYDRSIQILKEAIEKAKLDETDKAKALRKIIERFL